MPLSLLCFEFIEKLEKPEHEMQCNVSKCLRYWKMCHFNKPIAIIIGNHHAVSFVRLKRKCDAFAFIVTINIMRLRLIHFPCVCIPVSYGALIHRLNENSVFNFIAQPSQLFAAFIQFSYSRNSLDEGSFYCWSLLNICIPISIFNIQLSCLCEKHLSLFSILFKVSAKNGKTKKNKYFCA